jgi:hypothetical protein
MKIAHYRRRLPENYDHGPTQALTKEQGPVWDADPELYFKALVLRQAGRFGAIANSFSLLYLWRHDRAYRDWLVNRGYKIVTVVFGRAEIETHFAADAHKCPGHQALFGYTEDLDIPLDADLTAAFSSEIERNREIATQSDTFASAVGVDTRNWKITRILLSANEPNGNENTPPSRSFIWRGLSSIHFRRETIDELSVRGQGASIGCRRISDRRPDLANCRATS